LLVLLLLLLLLLFERFIGKYGVVVVIVGLPFALALVCFYGRCMILQFD